MRVNQIVQHHIKRRTLPLAAAMAKIKTICIDLSGTLHVDDQQTPGAVDALNRLRQTKVPIRFVTNTTKESGQTLYERLVHIGFQLDRNEIYSSLSAAASYVRQHDLRPMYLLTEDARRDFPDASEGSVENAVVVGLAPKAFDYAHMNRAFAILLNPNNQLVAIHEGKYYKTAGSLALGPGAFVRGLEYASNTKAIVVGKPNAFFFRSAIPADVPLSECIMIGDDPIDDVKGAMDAGMHAILVKTGKYRPEVSAEPTFLADNFAGAVEWLIERDFTVPDGKHDH